MTSEIRRQAKAINFGVIYGISGFGLARNLRIPRSEAQGFIDRYFERFPGIKEYMDKTVKFSKENNYVETLFGRVIHTPEINAKGPMAGFAKRAAINAPIQGTAADIIRRAMIRVPDAKKIYQQKCFFRCTMSCYLKLKKSIVRFDCSGPVRYGSGFTSFFENGYTFVSRCWPRN